MNITQTKTKATAVAMLVALGLGAIGSTAVLAKESAEDSQTGSYEVEVAMTDGTTKTVAVGFDNGTASVVAMQSDDLGSDAEGNEDAGEKGETDNN